MYLKNTSYQIKPSIKYDKLITLASESINGVISQQWCYKHRHSLYFITICTCVLSRLLYLYVLSMRKQHIGCIPHDLICKHGLKAIVLNHHLGATFANNCLCGLSFFSVPYSAQNPIMHDASVTMLPSLPVTDAMHCNLIHKYLVIHIAYGKIYLVGWLLECCILATFKVTVWQYVDSIVLRTGRPDRQHHDLISDSVTLSWNWANQSLPYSNNA